MKGLTKSLTSSPTGWLRMNVWRMSLQRTKSTIISWDGSNGVQTDSSDHVHQYLSNSYYLEPPHDKTNKIACALSEDSDQLGHTPSLIGVRMKKACVLSYPLSTQRRLWSDWADGRHNTILHRVRFFHQACDILCLSFSYMPYLTMWDKVSQNLAHLEANSHKIFQVS